MKLSLRTSAFPLVNRRVGAFARWSPRLGQQGNKVAASSLWARPNRPKPGSG
jgi:hypothetical protein